ncbi:MAG: VWA domain-containing protein [Bacteroidales bacterium]|nr:VWA domain-containing protein [Bacteroidales bacterium]MCF8455465.1 VWA domain-containing protein [Bacteroidales bacterium]
MDNLVFLNKDFFYLFILVAAMIVWYVFKQKKANASIQTSTLSAFKGSGTGLRVYFRHLIFIFRVLVVSLLIIVLARPQSSLDWTNTTTEGIDIVIALDISGSMLAEDFKPNRLEASKDVAIKFINGRPNDKIGLVVYSGESFTQCPLTTDHAVLINLFKDIKNGMIEDGTAVGSGLATAVTRLKESTAISKVVILLTDGVNNAGDISPMTAAEIAKTFGVRVYTVGVGTMGMAPYPATDFFGRKVYQQMEVEIDEATLQDIARMTDGRYFRATNNTKLAEIYEEIDKLEKSKIEVKEYSKKQEEFLPFALAAALLLIMEVLMRQTFLRNIP